MTVYTRSNNTDLYGMMRKLIPDNIECIQCNQFQEWWQARDYLHYIIQNGTGWVINMDNDAFIKDWGVILEMIAYMEQHGYDYAGMPDGGVCPHRCRSWVVMNPFFNIFNVDAIKPVFEQYPEWVVNSCGFNADWYDKKPDIVKGIYNHDYVEPYSSFFYFLYAKFKPLYLNAYGHNDGLSSMLLWNDKPFLYHSWYSREFATDPTHRQRIINLYNEVKG
jgi:hypothetical protein